MKNVNGYRDIAPCFQVRKNMAQILLAMPQEQAGKIFQAITRYAIEGTDPEGLDMLEASIFTGMKEDVDKSLNTFLNNAYGGYKSGCTKNGKEPMNKQNFLNDLKNGEIEPEGKTTQDLADETLQDTNAFLNGLRKH